ncbi:MAG: hypothetical protein ABIH01_04460, partial [Candidatus Omnitrophota bacterium]
DRIIFEGLRMLLNFQRKDQFLLTLILSGQMELKKNVDNIKQLAQRIFIRFHLDKFDEADTKAYIQHRLEIAGAKKPIFDAHAAKAIHERSGGIPRRINQLCELAMLTGYSKHLNTVGPEIVAETAEELER